MRGSEVEDRRKDEEMTAPITLPSLDEPTLTELLLADVEQHFQALAQAPAEILRHIGSPFAPEKDQEAPLSLAQAA
jgi:hypothetical protein